MKRWLTGMLALTMGLSMCGCGTAWRAAPLAEDADTGLARLELTVPGDWIAGGTEDLSVTVWMDRASELPTKIAFDAAVPAQLLLDRYWPGVLTVRSLPVELRVTGCDVEWIDAPEADAMIEGFTPSDFREKTA